MGRQFLSTKITLLIKYLINKLPSQIADLLSFYKYWSKATCRIRSFLHNMATIACQNHPIICSAGTEWWCSRHRQLFSGSARHYCVHTHGDDFGFFFRSGKNGLSYLPRANIQSFPCQESRNLIYRTYMKQTGEFYLRKALQRKKCFEKERK